MYRDEYKHIKEPLPYIQHLLKKDKEDDSSSISLEGIKTSNYLTKRNNTNSTINETASPNGSLIDIGK